MAIVVFVLLMIMVLLVFVARFADQREQNDPNWQSKYTLLSSNTKIMLPQFTQDVLLCSAAAKQEYDGTLPLSAAVKQEIHTERFVLSTLW